jgi:hypothetical protein
MFLILAKSSVRGIEAINSLCLARNYIHIITWILFSPINISLLRKAGRLCPIMKIPDRPRLPHATTELSYNRYVFTKFLMLHLCSYFDLVLLMELGNDCEGRTCSCSRPLIPLLWRRGPLLATTSKESKYFLIYLPYNYMKSEMFKQLVKSPSTCRHCLCTWASI